MNSTAHTTLVTSYPSGTFQTLVDEAFTAQFPRWSEISPFDPVKLVAEGLVGTLARTEARSRQMLQSALSAMPAIFGFEPKPAQLPVGLFQLRSPERVTATVPITMTPQFRSNEATWVLCPVAGAVLSPVEVTSRTQQGTATTLSLKTRGSLGELVLTFVPGSPQPVRRLALQVGTTTAKDLLIVDSTQQFTQYGTITLRRRDGAPLDASSVVVETDIPLHGVLTTNLVPFAFGQHVEELALQPLNGDPWESLPLPATLVGIPEKLTLRFPDGRRRELTRIADAALARTDLTDGFLYDGVHHRLVLPAADTLIADWNGGVEAVLTDTMHLPATPWISTDAQPALGDASSVLEALTPYAPLAPAMARETGVDFHRRFYAAMRQIPERAPGPRANEVAQLALTQLDALRALELSIEGSEATAYCIESSEAFRLNPGTAAQVRRRLEDALPLGTNLQVLPFQRFPLHVTATSSVPSESVAKALEALLLPPPFGELAGGDTRSVAELERLLTSRLGAPVQLTLRNDRGDFQHGYERPLGAFPVIHLGGGQ